MQQRKVINYSYKMLLKAKTLCIYKRCNRSLDLHFAQREKRGKSKRSQSYLYFFFYCSIICLGPLRRNCKKYIYRQKQSDQEEIVWQKKPRLVIMYDVYVLYVLIEGANFGISLKMLSFLNIKLSINNINRFGLCLLQNMKLELIFFIHDYEVYFVHT